MRGFTLIELLVVIAIIAILAAILFPVFSRARDRARLASCVSNMRQILLAERMYSDDYDGLYPAYRPMGPPFYSGHPGPGELQWCWWLETPDLIPLLTPYCKNTQIFRCPSDPTDLEHDTVSKTSYFTNPYMTTDGVWIPYCLTHFPIRMNPKQMDQANQFGAGPALTISHAERLQNHHKEGAPQYMSWRVIGYCDGHVKFKPGRKSVY